MNAELETLDFEGQFRRQFETFSWLLLLSPMAEGKARILVVGGTGYMGRRFVRASLALGHPTFVLSRPEAIGLDIEKLQMLLSFKNAGAHLLQVILIILRFCCFNFTYIRMFGLFDSVYGMFGMTGVV